MKTETSQNDAARSSTCFFARSRAVFAALSLIFLGILGRNAAAQTIPFNFFEVDAFDGPEYHLTLGLPYPALYFVFQYSNDLKTPWANFTERTDVAFGDPAPHFIDIPLASVLKRFYRARGISLSAPEDQDNDFMDDIWELQHGYLNPLNPNDANLASPELDAGGRNNLDYYRFKRGINANQDLISREVSLFNFGEAIARLETVSREVTLFNGASIPASNLQEIYSREVTAFNFGSSLAGVEAISREVTAYNFGAAIVGLEAVSREVTVFNGEGVPASDQQDLYSREVTAFNYGAPSNLLEAISREVSVNNTFGSPP